MTNRVLDVLRSDCWRGVPGAGDPYEWAMRGWMDAAMVDFAHGINLPFEPTPAEANFAANVILRLGRIKGVRLASEVGTPKEIINAGFGMEIVK